LTGTVQYRLNVTFDNGRQYYSNIVTLKKSSQDSHPELVGNMVTSNINITSPTNFDYTIYDFSGKSLLKGKLSAGTNSLNAVFLAQGMYVIRFNNGAQSWSDKFVKH
jgi:hypothetical protein